MFSTRAVSDTSEQREGRLKLIERLRRDGATVLEEASLPKLVGKTTLASRPAVVEQVRTWMRLASIDGVVDALLAMAHRRDATPLLAAIRCPTVVVAGAEDALIAVDEAESMARQISSATLEIIPKAGHLASLEQPSVFHAVIERWIKQAG